MTVKRFAGGRIGTPAELAPAKAAVLSFDVEAGTRGRDAAETWGRFAAAERA
jgi:hypothetical protein